MLGKTHLAFNTSLVYVPDAAETYYWEGQGGGIEGLNQDTWVVTYINQIKVAISDLGIRYHILCKGDDLRVIFLIPKIMTGQQSVRDLKNIIVTRIKNTMTKFGHKINIEESYGSSKYLAFSKETSIENVILPQTFRKIQKCYGANNAFINTLDDHIASAFSNAHSTARTSTICRPSYKVAIFWACWYIVHSSYYKTITVDMLTALMQIPNVLGGFPIIYLSNMAIRAESDLLSYFLCLYTYSEKFYSSVAQYFDMFLYGPSYLPRTTIALLKDPYSLPSTKPPLPSACLRKVVVPALKSLAKNENIIQLISLVESDVGKSFLEVLDTARPHKAKALNI